MPAETGLPFPSARTGWRVLSALFQKAGLLTALEIMHQEMGDIFRIPLPGFNPIVLVGPEANRFVLVSGRHDLLWRPEHDPVTSLLRHGVLVEDGQSHNLLRNAMNPVFHRRRLPEYVGAMLCRTDQVLSTWRDGEKYDMLVEMRKIALLILTETLFGVNFNAQIGRLWGDILRILAFISPGLWILWPQMPRPGYRQAIRRVDDFLFSIIHQRRQSLEGSSDLLGTLLSLPEMTDDLVRDQLLTMLIAGHDTSTALLTWTLYLLGCHPQAMQRAYQEVDEVVGNHLPQVEHTTGLNFLDQVIHETLRLYPPIHVGNRTAAVELEFQGYRIPAGSRVMYSIYLSHRHPRYWSEPDRFLPERFAGQDRHTLPAYTYLPFGGGPRNCIGLAYAQVEVKIVLARLFQKFRLELLPQEVHPHMGATLEPRPGVKMRVRARI